MKSLGVILILLLSFRAQALVKVAFFSGRDSVGNRIELEPGGQYYHVALSYRGMWLHAHPMTGVELLLDLRGLGSYRILIDASALEPTDLFVEEALNKKYSLFESWSHDEFTYCSKLVAKFFNINPTPMSFSSKPWQDLNQLPVGSLGLSPDDLFFELKQRGFLFGGQKSHCAALFKN